jgi:Zn finger protein HypA/HybF involved in hydrogenase expression
MFMYCEDCGYDSGDEGNNKELLKKVKSDYKEEQKEEPSFDSFRDAKCPKCKSFNLNVD